MRSRSFLICVVAASALLSASFAHADDDAANSSINDAINQAYLATRFDEAEGALVDVAENCNDCSSSVIARAWMYIGIVRGAGKSDMRGARAAFLDAFQIDPGVMLDEQLATPEVAQLFDEVRSAAGRSDPGAPGTGLERLLPVIDCQPLPLELATRQPFPILCSTYDGVSAMTLFYRMRDGQWSEIELSFDKNLGGYSSLIPCKDTKKAGTLQYYVEGRNALSEVIRGLGSARKPVDVRVVEETGEGAPAIPGQVAPERCLDTASTGTPIAEFGAWGASCNLHDDCQMDLVCLRGTCETPPSCDGDSDCEGGLECTAEACQRQGAPESMHGEGFEHWVGLHYAQDLPWMSGDNVCDSGSDDADSYDCFVGGNRYSSILNENRGGQISSGFAWGSGRFLLSYERQIIEDRPEVSLETRLGFAFGGGPSGNVSFLPLHLEARGKYWLQERPLDEDLLGTFVMVGLGVGSVASSKDIQVEDCDLDQDGEVDAFDNAPFEVPDCLTRAQAVLDEDYSGIRTVEAYQRLGNFFLELGGGGMMRLGKNGGLTAHLNLMLMIPRSALVLQPGVGYVMGF